MRYIKVITKEILSDNYAEKRYEELKKAIDRKERALEKVYLIDKNGEIIKES